jgi:hypothetical protein
VHTPNQRRGKERNFLIPASTTVNSKWLVLSRSHVPYLFIH